jgi:hypothetical protein
MEYEKAVAVLKKLQDKPSLDAEEKEALTTAIGLLSLGSLSLSRLKAQKAKREKSIEW